MISLYCRPSARPREISSRSHNINITRTAGILSHRLAKIKYYDRLSQGCLAATIPCDCGSVLASAEDLTF